MGIDNAKRAGSTVPAVERCLSLLAKGPSNVRGLGSPRFGGLADEYPEIKKWDEDDQDDGYLRIAVHRGQIEIIEGKKLPHNGYRDPTPAEARKLKKRYGERLRQMVVKDCNDDCRWALWYRVRRPAHPTTDKAPDYRGLVLGYERLRNSAQLFKDSLPSLAEFKGMVEPHRRIDEYRTMTAKLPPQIRACYPTIDEYKKQIDREGETSSEYGRAKALEMDWTSVEASAVPMILQIQNEVMPDVATLSTQGRRYLLKKSIPPQR